MLYLRLVWVYLILSISLWAQSAYHYSYVPKVVYENQLFSITVVSSENNATLIFDKNSPYQPLFMHPLLVKNGEDIFYTFYFKAAKKDIVIPRLYIHSGTSEVALEEKHIPLKALEADTYFAGVLATEFTIKGQQVSNYDTKNHIVTLSIEAYEANLEDMKLDNIKEYGIENLKRKDAKVSAEFYAVLPREQKTLTFTYFNTIKKRYIPMTIAVEVANASVTTQSDLNPKVDAFERLKRYALLFFTLFFLGMFVWKRDFLYLILGVISIITLLTFYIPHKKICVKQGAPLYIIPTDTSTVGTRIEQQLDTMLLGSRGEYIKIEYKKGIIGWIKDEDICNN